MYNKATVMSAIMVPLSWSLFAHVQEKIQQIQEAGLPTNSITLLALSIMSYLTIICNSYAAIMAFINAERMSQIPLKISQTAADKPDVGAIRGDVVTIIMYHVKVQFWSLLRAYWFFYFITGYLSIWIELNLYVWVITGSFPLQLFASTSTGVALLPIGLFWLG